LHLLLAGAAVRLRDHVRGVLRSPTDRGPHPGGIGCTGRAAATIPHAVVEEFDGAAHLANLEQPARFSAVLGDFLDMHTASG